MKKLKVLFAAIVIGVLFTACSLTVPVSATSNEIGSKVGRATTTQVLGFFPDGGNAGIKTAAENGNITNVATVDFKESMILGPMVMRYETIVTGN